jgi:hypothetical protein
MKTDHPVKTMVKTQLPPFQLPLPNNFFGLSAFDHTFFSSIHTMAPVGHLWIGTWVWWFLE